MAYQKPAVTVRQVQKTRSPIYPDPDFQSCVVGPGYYWQDPSREDTEMNSVYDSSYDGAQLVMSGGDFSTHSNIIDDTVIVDLVRTSGSGGTIGEVKHLEKDTDFTVSNGEITINQDLSGFTGTNDEANVRVGFLAAREDIKNSFEKITEPQQIKDWVGIPKTFNPLAFGAELMLTNSGAATNIVGVDGTQPPETQDHSNAISILAGQKEMYAIAPLTQVSAENDKYLSHVQTMSLPENKRKRIVFTNQDVTSYPTSEFPTVSEKDTVAQDIQDYATAKGEKRFFAIHPDGAFIEEYRHVSTLKQSFMQAVYGSGFDLKPRFVNTMQVGGTRYKAFQEITETIRQDLIANGIDYLTVYAPVPGYYYNVAVAGQTIRKRPEAPLTNSAISGISRVYRSNDYFSEDQLDTIAEGGTWIIEELSPNALINRHQLSTDATTIETRELSITTALDYVDYYFRQLVSPLIGKRNITPSFLKEIDAIMNGGAERLVADGYVEAVDILSIEQDELEPDTLRVTVSVTPFYPVNNIKITLVF